MLNLKRDIERSMARLKLKMAIQQIQHYFAPLTVWVKLASPVTMDLELLDPHSKESVTLFDIPCRQIVTTVQLYQLINLIETQAKARKPSLFSKHVVNQIQHG